MAGSGKNAEGAAGGLRQVRRSYDWEATAPSTAIVEAVADLKGVDSIALATDEDTPLYEYVDPEALDALLTDRPGSGIEVTLDVDGYTARITGNRLVVEPPETDAGDSE